MTTNRFRYGGAAALVELHERHLRDFLAVWRRVDERGLELPESSEPDYATREALLAHVLGCAAGYLCWICRQLGVTSPALDRPDPEGLATRAESYMEEVLAAWRGSSLRDLTEGRAFHPAHESPWGPPYCIDAMLEHAAMHPIRHAHQLRRLEAESPASR